MLWSSRMRSFLALSNFSAIAVPEPLFYCRRSFILTGAAVGCSSLIDRRFHSPRLKVEIGAPIAAAGSCSKSRGFCSEGRASGEIHVIVGPMFAGKTSTLIKRMKTESSNGRSIAIIKSDKDTRYGKDSIVTHDGESLPCFPLPDLLSFRHKLSSEAYAKLDVIGVDEAQFFGDLYEFCCEAADRDGKVVIVAGLDGDYRRRRFGSVLDVVPIADSVTKLAARCEVCGGRASFTLRKTDEKKTEVIGGAEVYMPVCRKHYVAGRSVVKEAAEV
ncbi:hypothetical protein M569_00976, partial [Genlisea aurea]